MTSSLIDSAGVEFNPDIHQATRAGTPRTNKAGRYFLKGRRGPAVKRSPQGPSVRRQASPAKPAETQESASSPAPASSPSVELSPKLREIAPANPEEILGRELPPVTVAPEGDGAPEMDLPEEEAAPPTPTAPGSYVAPDAPAAPDEGSGALQSEGMAALAVSVLETSARFGIDADEWVLSPEERADLQGSVCKVLDKYGVGREVSPETELAVKIVAVGVRRAPMPKTRLKLKSWFGDLWAKMKGQKAEKEPAKAE